MSATENRIVKMVFDNASFKKGAADTQTQLANLDKAVSKSGNNKGLLNMGSAMETVKVKASAMQVAVGAAIATIASKATAAGLNMAKSLSLDPIKAGFDEYELKMKSIQTILANTKGESLKTVTVALNELNEYSDKTIYNFANMTENIGKLTTAGITLDDATSVVKGFSNMVALAGGDANAAAGAMEQFGQGLQAGTIKAMDWMSISNRGLGSQSLQKAFFETARAFGPLKDVPISTTFEEWSKANGGFKASLEEGWLTTEVATEALKVMTGDVKDVQQLMKMGFDKKTARDMLGIAENALDSATKVRTLTAFWGTLQEQIGSGWSQVMETIFGDFNEATVLFTDLSNKTGEWIGAFFEGLQAVIGAWDEMGGRAALLTTIKHILAPIVTIIGAIAKGINLAFGGEGGGGFLATFSKALEHASRPLNIIAKLVTGQITPMQALKRLFEVTTNAVRNFGSWLGEILQKLAGLVGIKLPDFSGFFGFFGDIRKVVIDVLDQIDKLIQKGASIGEIFGNIKVKLPSMPDMPSMPSMPEMPSMPKVGRLFGGQDLGAEKSKIVGLASGVKDLKVNLAEFNVEDAKSKSGMMFNPDADISGGRVRDIVEQSDKVQAATGIMGNALQVVKEKFLGFMESFSFDDLIASFNIAVLSVFFIRMSQMMKTFTDGFKGFTGAMGSIEGALSSFQTSARAKLIMNIAIAIAVLAAAIWVLARIPKDKLMNAVGALAGVALILKVTLSSFSKTIEALDGKGMNMKMLALGASMVLLAISISIIASAMKKLQDVDWNAVVKAGVAMGILSIAMQALGKINNPNILKAAFAMVVISGALMLFAIAIRKFSGLEFKTFAEGMSYVAVALGVLAITMNKFTSSIAGAVALVVVVGALHLLEKVIRKYADLDWGAFANGMGKVVLALAGLVFTLHGFQSSLAGAAAMIVVVYGLNELYDVIKLFDGMNWGTFGKGISIVVIALLALGGALALIGFFSLLILAGAAALLVFAAAVVLIGVGIGSLAAGLAAMIALGAGLGVAITAFFTSLAIGIAVFLTTLAAEAPIIKKAILDILKVVIDTVVEAVPMIIDGFKRLFKAIKAQFSGGESAQTKALMGKESKSWIEKIKDSIKEKIPLIVEKAKELIIRFIEGLVKHSKSIGQKGAELVAGLIGGIASRIGTIVESAVNLIIKFAEGIAQGYDRILKAGVKLIADFLHSLANTIRTGSAAIGGGISDVVDAMKDVGVDLVKGIISGVTSMVGDALRAIGDLASGMVNKAKSILDIFSPSRVFKDIGTFLVAGLTKGIQDNAVSAINAVASMVSGQIAIANEYVSKFIQGLDQQALAATAKAVGLQAAAEKAARAAEKAQKRADKTKKNKKDDKAANKLENRAEAIQRQADRATKKAEKKEARVQKAIEAQDRQRLFLDSSTIDRAKMRSEDAQTAIDDAKAAEMKAAANLAEANALDRAAKGPGLTAKERKAMKKQADDLRKAADNQAKAANAAMRRARTLAGEALTLQTQAGAEAAAEFQRRYEEEARLDREEAEFNKLSDEEKAKKRREMAAALQTKADQDLAAAKQLAYTDLEAANALAEEAMNQAEQARQWILDAESLEKQIEEAKRQGTGQQNTEVGGTVVNLDPTEAAALAYSRYSDLYSSSTAAAAAGQHVEFNQYNTSPEALNPIEIYRQSNNLFTQAVQRLEPAA